LKTEHGHYMYYNLKRTTSSSYVKAKLYGSYMIS